MKNKNVDYLRKALGLERNIVGVKFFPYQQEVENSSASLVTFSIPFCGMVQKACQGEVVKANEKSFSCPGGMHALGICEEPEHTKSGRLYQHCGLYEDFSIAKQINDAMHHIEHKMCGIEVGPLEKLDKADIVIIICNSRQAMRLMQGYAYSHGPANNLSSIGNQAMCSDLVAKPFTNNDINISLLCCGARASARCDDGEMGIGMPINLFDSVVNGVIQTINLTETNKQKKAILDRLSCENELGVSIIMNFSYGINSRNYRNYCAEMEAKKE